MYKIVIAPLPNMLRLETGQLWTRQGSSRSGGGRVVPVTSILPSSRRETTPYFIC
jgi:hypothetical protein